MPTDKIFLKGLVFYGKHGHLKAESELGQKFVVDVEMHCDLKPAGQSDELLKTINYALVYKNIKHIMEGERCKLLETLAEKISAAIIKQFPVAEVLVKIKKPQVAFENVLEYVGVEIKRTTT